jgi:uncharacterized protein with GYD domain
MLASPLGPLWLLAIWRGKGAVKGNLMARYIISGSYSVDAMKGMVARPSDRAAATGALIKASGGTMETFYLTTGEQDFVMTVTTDDSIGMLAALIAAGSSGSVTGLKTVQAFTSDEFLTAQTRASAMLPGYRAPN